MKDYSMVIDAIDTADKALQQCKEVSTTAYVGNDMLEQIATYLWQVAENAGFPCTSARASYHFTQVFFRERLVSVKVQTAGMRSTMGVFDIVDGEIKMHSDAPFGEETMIELAMRWSELKKDVDERIETHMKLRLAKIKNELFEIKKNNEILTSFKL